MISLRYRLLDLFSERIFGGNQLPVFPDAAGLSDERMGSIARELNLSETRSSSRTRGGLRGAALFYRRRRTRRGDAPG